MVQHFEVTVALQARAEEKRKEDPKRSKDTKNKEKAQEKEKEEKRKQASRVRGSLTLEFSLNSKPTDFAPKHFGRQLSCVLSVDFSDLTLAWLT